MIITHPDNIDAIKNQFKSDHIHLLDTFEIKASPYVEKEKWTGSWKRTGKLPDTRFVEMFDITNPPKWAIYFGLVEKEMELVFYEVKNPYTYNQFKINFV